MSSQESTNPTKSPPVVVVPPASEETQSATIRVAVELEASVRAARGQQPEEAVYPTAVEICGNTNGHDHRLLSRGKCIAGSLGVIFVIATVLISILIVRNMNGLPSDASNSISQPLPSMSPTVGLLSSTPNPNLVLSPKPSLFPTANPTAPPSILTLSPTALPTEEPTMIPTFTPAPSTMPTFTLPTNCARAPLKEVFFPESCGDCYNVLTAVDGDFAITTADNQLRPYNLVDGSWKQMQLLTVETSGALIPAISGNVAVVGAYLENGGIGAVYIYERDPISNMWNLATRLAPADLTSGAYFGWSVAVDGDVVVVGAHDDRVGNIGSAYVFRRDGTGGGWSQEAKLAPEDANLRRFGWSVDVKGNTVVVGDIWYGSSFGGSVFVYNYNTKRSTWNQFQDNISNDDCDRYFGNSVVLTEDGELFIGCGGVDSDAGAVYHYAPSTNGGSYEMRQKITASDRSAYDSFGSLGQVSVDGNVMVVGADGANQGQVYVYARDSPSGSWIEVTNILAPVGEVEFGDWVSLSGNKLLVGADNNGYAYLLESCSGTPS